MGGQASKEEQTNVVAQDNGFHMVEIHAPTMGLSIVAILTILAILGLGHRCANSMRKRYHRRPRYFQPGIVQPRRHYPAFEHEPYPYINVDMMRRPTPPGSIQEIPMEHIAPPRQPRPPREERNGSRDRNGVQREARTAVVATNTR